MTQTPHPRSPAQPGGGSGAGGPRPGPPPELHAASSIAPGDTSTSIVIEPSAEPQIKTGAVRVTAYDDLVYATRKGADGQDVPLRLDLLVPATAGAKPLVVYFPGGGFMVARKEMALDRRSYIAEAGYVVASVEYRTVPLGATYTEAAADAKSAIRFLRTHAAQYGIDPAKAAVWGESAGGYLAALVGATNGVAAFETPDNSEASSDVHAVIDLFGASDLLRLAEDFDPDTQRIHLRPGNPFAAFVFGPGAAGKSLADDPEAVAAADPTRYVNAATPPFLLFHGSADNLISPSQTLLLHTALREHGVESTRYVLNGSGHGDLAVMFGSPDAAPPWSTQEFMAYITEFLGRQLRA
jgi:acetyl esterase/lipase